MIASIFMRKWATNNGQSNQYKYKRTLAPIQIARKLKYVYAAYAKLD